MLEEKLSTQRLDEDSNSFLLILPERRFLTVEFSICESYLFFISPLSAKPERGRRGLPYSQIEIKEGEGEFLKITLLEEPLLEQVKKIDCEGEKRLFFIYLENLKNSLSFYGYNKEEVLSCKTPIELKEIKCLPSKNCFLI